MFGAFNIPLELKAELKDVGRVYHDALEVLNKPVKFLRWSVNYRYPFLHIPLPYYIAQPAWQQVTNGQFTER